MIVISACRRHRKSYVGMGKPDPTLIVSVTYCKIRRIFVGESSELLAMPQVVGSLLKLHITAALVPLAQMR